MHRLRIPGLFVAIFLLVTSGCASTGESDDQVWRTSSFENSDRVWAAIKLALVELDYEIEESHREDGKIRATRTGGEMVIELNIDQIQRTQDQVNVFIRPGDGGGATSATRKDLDAAGDRFLEILNGQLGR